MAALQTWTPAINREQHVRDDGSFALSGATDYVWEILVSAFRTAAGAGGTPGPTATMILQ
jgi:hypothetical protein